MRKPRDLAVSPPKGAFALMSAREVNLLDLGLDSVDSMNEAEAGRRASNATLNAGQAAVSALNRIRGRK